jgi:hypothetical protein
VVPVVHVVGVEEVKIDVYDLIVEEQMEVEVELLNMPKLLRRSIVTRSMHALHMSQPVPSMYRVLQNYQMMIGHSTPLAHFM